MFGSIILDVLIGLIFVFLTLSLICSVATEALASVLKWRSETLLTGIKDLLNDKEGVGLVRDLYNHALINPRSDGNAPTAADAVHKPAYIAPTQFADALLDVLQQRGPATVGFTPSAQTNQLLSGMLDRAAGDVDALRTEMSKWFDTAMDRVSGAYKRKTQLCSFIIAIALATLLNADILRIATQLYQNPSVVKQIQPASQTADEALKKLSSLSLPLGWFDNDGKLISPHPLLVSKDYPGLGEALGWGLAVLGWLIAALGTLFGAPFWFDMLNKMMVIRSTVKPHEKSPEERSDDRQQPSVSPRQANQPSTHGTTQDAGSG